MEMEIKRKKFGNALKAFQREDTAKIDCGAGWVVEIKPYSSVIKELSKVQAQMRTQGVLKSKNNGVVKLPSVALANPTRNSLVDDDNDEFLLGSLENDIRFFCDNVLVGWEGLRDDDGNEVPYDKDTAYSVMTEQGEAGNQFYRELFASSMNASLFVKTLEQQIEEDAKNS